MDGWVPIEDYAVLGDGRSAALIASDGAVDWWPVPALDAPPLFGALLDPDHGGRMSFAADGLRHSTRRYLPATNVLETVVTTATGTARITDSLNVGLAGRLPWSELARRVDGIDGHVTIRWDIALPGGASGAAPAAAGPVTQVGDVLLAVVTNQGRPGSGDLAGELTVGCGDRGTVAIVAVRDEPLYVPTWQQVDARIDRTVAHWRDWTAELSTGGPWQGAQQRSALALKTLIYEPAGAIAAAVTTSLPERIGGDKNWDYRFSWVRDSSFTLEALMHLGLAEETQRATRWLLAALRTSQPKLHIFYTLEAGTPDGEEHLDVPGYRDSRPVRSGNGAATQSQLGCYGDLFDMISRYVDAGHVLDEADRHLLADYADQVVDDWQRPDSGIWELGRQRQYTFSKMGCWVALHRACRLARAGQLPDDRVARWAGTAGDIRDWVDGHAWSDAKQSYTLAADTDDLDAAVLLAARTGYDTGPRLVSTIDAVRAELGVPDSPLLYRYSGMDREEGAFVACTFWEVQARALTGQHRRAAELMARAVGLANDLGLLAEQVDPSSGALLGNIPQALSHLALINAAHSLAATDDP